MQPKGEQLSGGSRIRRPDLSEREELVLRYIVQHYVLTANPVGSRYLSKRLEEESLSAATLRNVMADLEEKGYITHPHTSAGRMPTDIGYRLYVDMLVRMEGVSHEVQREIAERFDPRGVQGDMLKETSRLIAAITKQLGVVTTPEILDGTLDRLELVQLASNRLMVVLSLRAGLVKTVMLELIEDVERDRIEAVSALLNERLVGLTIREIQSTFRDRLKDLADQPDTGGLVRYFIDSADRVFDNRTGSDRIHLVPASDILHQPEFSSTDQFRGIVELMENEEIIIHLLEENQPQPDTVRVTIGSELGDERMQEYSMIATRYRAGETYGTIGLIGPKRMDYARLMSLVGFVAARLSEGFGEGS